MEGTPVEKLLIFTSEDWSVSHVRTKLLFFFPGFPGEKGVLCRTCTVNLNGSGYAEFTGYAECTRCLHIGDRIDMHMCSTIYPKFQLSCPTNGLSPETLSTFLGRRRRGPSIRKPSIKY